MRESGTEPVIRVMVEASTDELCQKYVDQVVAVIESEGWQCHSTMKRVYLWAGALMCQVLVYPAARAVRLYMTRREKTWIKEHMRRRWKDLRSGPAGDTPG